MKQSKKRARRNVTETSDGGLGHAAPSVLSELLCRISLLEESHDKVSHLQTKVAALEARVTELEGELIRAEDRDFAVGRGVSRTILAIREGKTAVLAERLHRGADPNHDDGLGGTCLVHSVGRERPRPECTRLLIDHGADVSYCFPADNASLVFLLVQSFVYLSSQSSFSPGDYMLTADLLVEAGAPIDEIQDEDLTAMSILLQEMHVPLLGTRRYRERNGLIQVLDRTYWREYGHDPFLRVSSEASSWLLLKGAADDNAGRVDITRVRSIKPDSREDVIKSLEQYKRMRGTFTHILLTMKNANTLSPFCSLRGHESTILPAIAAFAGSTGWSLRKLEESQAVLKDAIDRFNVDGASGDDSFYGEVDEDGDDDSYEVDDEENEDEDNTDGGGSDSDDGDY